MRGLTILNKLRQLYEEAPQNLGEEALNLHKQSDGYKIHQSLIDVPPTDIIITTNDK